MPAQNQNHVQGTPHAHSSTAQSAVSIRTARLSDIGGTASSMGAAGDIASMIYSAGPELYDFIYQTSEHDARAYIEYEFKSGKGFCGHSNLTVAELNSAVVGTGCFFDGKAYGRLTFETMSNMFKFYGLIRIWPVLLRSARMSSIMKKPAKGETYLSNFGVAPAVRGTGIGRLMLSSHFAQARAAGYQRFTLDVADNNPRAERLYASLGLKVVSNKKFSGSRPGHAVPNAKRMVMDLK